VLIYLKKNHNSFGTPVFLHTEIVNKTAFIVSKFNHRKFIHTQEIL